ncbi:hypothetical protein ACFFGT_04960 [Mucilaginibacter angelicae]|uniref:MFS transporter n=1 Tax=Mucilaginibacter angelicae TaxID=869718 RepID=A0ABV6L1K0_9SPHI
MAHYVSAAPLWAVIVFIPVFLYSVFFITRTARQAALNAGLAQHQARNIRFGIFGFSVLYLLYASMLALNGVLDVNALPPRALVWAGIPLMVILFAIIGNLPLYKRLLQSIPLEALIRVHIFRVVGVFFLILLSYRVLPARFGLFAGLGDIITALFAYPVARMASRQQRGWKLAVYLWNIFGIMDIIDLLTVAVLTGSGGNLREMAIFPFVWFPVFAPATILFLHAAVFRKLGQQAAGDHNRRP